MHNISLGGSLALSSLLVVLVGCNVSVFAPPDLPAELAMVVNNKEAFAQDPNDSHADITGGTIMDDLNTLDGCWGTYGTLSIELDPPGVDPATLPAIVPDSLEFDEGQVFIFNRDAGEMSWQTITVDAFGSAPVAQSFIGTFTLFEDNQINFSSDTGGFSDPLTGEIVLFTSEQADEYQWLVTLNGNRLKLQEIIPEGETRVVSRDDLVFRRFDCPQ